MESKPIIDVAANVFFLEKRSERVALPAGDANAVLVPNMASSADLLRNDDGALKSGFRKELFITLRVCAAHFRPLVEIRQFNVENRGLVRVETAVDADFFVIVDKLQGYILTLSDIIDQSTIKDSDSLLQRLADEKNQAYINYQKALENKNAEQAAYWKAKAEGYPEELASKIAKNEAQRQKALQSSGKSRSSSGGKGNSPYYETVKTEGYDDNGNKVTKTEKRPLRSSGKKSNNTGNKRQSRIRI